MDFREALSGHVIVVTGAAQGLGEAIAEGLANCGAKVALCGLNASALNKVAARIEDKHGTEMVLSSECDISDEIQTADYFDNLIARFGRVDAIINNAGLGCASIRPDFLSNPVPIWQLDPGEWRKIVEVNTIGTFLMSRWAIPHMVEQGRGRVINVTTTFQTMLSPAFGAYGPSKAGVEAMTAILSRELEGTGVTANVVVPGGPADTEQVPDSIVEDRGKLLRPDIMVPVIRWLCSDQSSAINGRRFDAVHWDDNISVEKSIAKSSTEPVAWPQLERPIVMPGDAAGDRNNNNVLSKIAKAEGGVENQADFGKPVYLVSNVEVRDREQFKNYQRPARAAVEKYGGKFLAEGATPEQLEGDWLPKRMAILRFPDADAARTFFHSPEYQAARQHRLPAASFNIVLVDPLTGVAGDMV